MPTCQALSRTLLHVVHNVDLPVDCISAWYLDGTNIRTMKDILPKGAVGNVQEQEPAEIGVVLTAAEEDGDSPGIAPPELFDLASKARLWN